MGLAYPGLDIGSAGKASARTQTALIDSRVYDSIHLFLK